MTTEISYGLHFTWANILISLTGIVGNLISLYCLWKVKKSQGNRSLSNAEKLLLSLNIADLSQAVIVLPYHIYYNMSTPTDTTKALNVYLTAIGFWFSSLIIFLIALNRYIKITKPATYDHISSKRLISCTIVALFAVVFILPFVYFINIRLKFVVNTIVTFLTMASMTTFYILITKQIVHSNRSVRAAALNTLSDQMEIRLNYNVLILIAVHIFCCFYLFAVTLVFTFNRSAIDFQLHSKIGIVFISANTSINPVIYVLRNDSYRQILANVFNTGIHQPPQPLPTINEGGSETHIEKSCSVVVVSNHIETNKARRNVELEMFHDNKQAQKEIAAQHENQQ